MNTINTALCDDTLGRLLALDGALTDLRNTRAKVAAALQACENLLLGADSPLGSALSPAERLALASVQCRSAGIGILADEYRSRAHAGAQLGPAWQSLLDAPGSDMAAADPRVRTLAQFVQTLECEPARRNKDDLHALQAAGLETADIVLLAQTIGFVACQLRLFAGWQALRDVPGGALDGTGAPPAAGAEAGTEPFVHPANLPPPGQALEIAGFTSRTLDWQSWLPLPASSTLSAGQQAVLDMSHPKARESDFYRLLVHQPQVLQQRSLAFNAIMYAPGGLPRAEREIAATAVSRSNGCVYCTAVHAQRFEQLARRNDVMAQIFARPESAGTNARERTLIAASMALTRQPAAFCARDVLALRAAGLAAREILDWLHVTSLFAWANRLMLNLGQESG